MLRSELLQRALIPVFIVLLSAARPADGGSVRIESETNPNDRVDAVLHVVFDPNDAQLNGIKAEIEKLQPGQPVAWSIVRLGLNKQSPAVVEAEKTADDKLSLTWVEAGSWPSGVKRSWSITPQIPPGFVGPWSCVTSADGQLELHHAQRGLVFRYNREPVHRPGLPLTQERGAYIHPFLTPSGRLATGDFSPAHTHHRGFFLAYAKTKRGTLAPDFWNIHGGTAKIVTDPAKIKTVAGPVTTRLSTAHSWQLREKNRPEQKSGESVMEETWQVQVYDIPGQPAWVWDLTSVQTPVNEDLELTKYRYGGMAYRGPEPFVKGKLDVLTSEGNTDRTTADQKPARWIDLTGPSEDGSMKYVGAVMCDHPENVRHPNVVRIHPVSLPFFTFVPSHPATLNLKAGTSYVWKYRTMVHDGRPNRTRDQALFDDFASPIAVRLVP